MSRIARALVPVLLVAAAGCATGSSFTSTWKAPDAQPLTGSGKKVAALIISKDESVRRGSEDLLSYQLTKRGAKGIPAYALIPADAVQDKDKAKAAFEKAGIQGVVSMRVVGKNQELNYQPGSTWASPWGSAYYGSFWGGGGGGYYAWGWGGVYDPGYLRTDTIVTIETLVFSLEQDKLIWAGMSRTSNPDSVPDLIRELVEKAAKEMRKQGLIGAAPK
jgi:hypothetical protein